MEANLPYAVVAKQNISFEGAGLTVDNIFRIYRVEGGYLSWEPGRIINAITEFEQGKGYIIIPSATLDLTEYVVPPLTAIKPQAAPPTITQDDEANTISASHELGTENILVSVNDAAYADYTGEISVGNVDLAAGYYKFKTKETSTYAESEPALSAAFNYEAPPLPQVADPVITADDEANTISADFGDANSSQLQVSTNDGAWTNYTANEPINVGNVDRAVGFFKFKALGDGVSYSDSNVAQSPAFNFETPVLPQVAVPVITQDDEADTISADFGDGNSAQLQVSVSDGSWTNYTANDVISVGDVDRPSGYYKFKALGDGTSYEDSDVVDSAAFNQVPQLAAPIITQDDDADTISADFGDANGGTLQVSENDGAYTAYTADTVINVGDVDRPAGYWKFKALGDGVTFNDSEVAESAAFHEANANLMPGFQLHDPLAQLNNAGPTFVDGIATLSAGGWGTLASPDLQFTDGAMALMKVDPAQEAGGEIYMFVRPLNDNGNYGTRRSVSFVWNAANSNFDVWTRQDDTDEQEAVTVVAGDFVGMEYDTDHVNAVKYSGGVKTVIRTFTGISLPVYLMYMSENSDLYYPQDNGLFIVPTT